MRVIWIAIATTILAVFGGCGSDGRSRTPDAPANYGDTAARNASTIVNMWSGAPVDPTAIPLGDGKVSVDAPAVGSVLSCQQPNPNAPGASAAGPWIHGIAWDATVKVAAKGLLGWPVARITVEVADGSRRIETNGLPVTTKTGVFPIAPDDPAYVFDQNPNAIGEVAIDVKLSATPRPAPKPVCLPLGPIGVALNGVAIFSAVDAAGRDAVAHEVQDICDGHPAERSQYHYHHIPYCVRDAVLGSSTVVGWAFDGYPIVVERDAARALPTNDDLDACHGRTSPVVIDGKEVVSYHYSATLEYPYTVGCFHGTNVAPR
jgi:hypothetical protein